MGWFPRHVYHSISLCGGPVDTADAACRLFSSNVICHTVIVVKRCWVHNTRRVRRGSQGTCATIMLRRKGFHLLSKKSLPQTQLKRARMRSSLSAQRRVDLCARVQKWRHHSRQLVRLVFIAPQTPSAKSGTQLCSG